MTKPRLRVKVFPFRERLCMGNIIWAERDQGSSHNRTSRYAANSGGEFPKDHPVGGSMYGDDGQGGDGENIKSFRALGYWASCFPDGDGITWRPLNGQSDEQCMADIKAAFGWDARWGRALGKDI